MLWSAGLLIALLLITWWGIRRFRANKHAKLRISARKTLLQQNIREFKRRLEQTMGDEFDVFTQVRLADLIVYQAEQDRTSQEMQQQIESSTVDFVLAEKGTGNIACVLMLSQQDKVGSRQLFNKKICQQAQLPFLLIDVHNALTDKQIQHKIRSLLEPVIALDESPTDQIKVYLEPGQSQDRRQEMNLNA